VLYREDTKPVYQLLTLNYDDSIIKFSTTHIVTHYHILFLT